MVLGLSSTASIAVIRGLISNSVGEWLCCLFENIGVGEIFTAELWSLYFCLRLASRYNICVASIGLFSSGQFD
jgi:hypothetical protein